MELNSILYSLLGGALIGVAVTLMLLFNGRVTGISGILASSLAKPNSESLWRWMFLAGMIVGGFFMYQIRPDLFVNVSGRSLAAVAIAGLLVGYGTVMGSGCTSGHGICGLSRFSVRSLLATITFMFFGFLSVQIVNYFLGGSI
ncbi:YeeE/YedE family protein [bacterium]|nr:YeeE/YedE family protein [bacterium]